VAPPHLLVLGKPSVSANKVTLRLSCTSARLSLSPNETKTITLTLNRRGRSLLARFRKLPVTIAGAVDTAVAETARATLHPRRKPPHHHP
jgi:hypothetical protein